VERKEEVPVTAEAKIEAYLTRRIEEIKQGRVPLEGPFEKSSFMLSTQVLADAGFITHDQKFEWNDRMLREVG